MIGILDLQGDVIEHLDHLERLGVPARRVKAPADLEGLVGLILPGGESTCISKLLRIFELHDALLAAHENGMKVWGTCAGAILLARVVTGEKAHLGLIDIEIERNGFGSQLESFICDASVPRVSEEKLPLTFIRAPKIRSVGPGVDVLLQIDDYVAAAESVSVLITIFHPEMTGSLAFHRHFAVKCGLTVNPEKNRNVTSWTATSWTRYARIA